MYRFTANSMFIFAVVLSSGLVKNVEFEACGEGLYSYMTGDKQVAEAIRQHPLVKQGRIADRSEPEDEVVGKPMDDMETDANVLHFDNITKAKNYLHKKFQIDTRGLKSPDSVRAKAKELGVVIDF